MFSFSLIAISNHEKNQKEKVLSKLESLQIEVKCYMNKKNMISFLNDLEELSKIKVKSD